MSIRTAFWLIRNIPYLAGLLVGMGVMALYAALPVPVVLGLVLSGALTIWAQAKLADRVTDAIFGEE